MANILMTGATGLIGSWVRREWGPIRPDDQLVEAGRTDVNLLEPGNFVDLIDHVRPRAVLHLAWTAGSVPDYRHSAENHRWATVTLEAAERCRAIRARFFAFGTVLDDRPPSDAYTRAKRNLRQALEPTIAAGEATWVRPFYVFDAEAGRPTVLAMARAAQQAGATATVRHPHAQHDFVHATDVARGVLAILRGDLNGVIEIGSGRQHTVADLMARSGFDWTAAEEADEEAHDNRAADTSILRATGWTSAETDRYFGDD